MNLIPASELTLNLIVFDFRKDIFTLSCFYFNYTFKGILTFASGQKH